MPGVLAIVLPGVLAVMPGVLAIVLPDPFGHLRTTVMPDPLGHPWQPEIHLEPQTATEALPGHIIVAGAAFLPAPATRNDPAGPCKALSGRR